MDRLARLLPFISPPLLPPLSVSQVEFPSPLPPLPDLSSLLASLQPHYSVMVGDREAANRPIFRTTVAQVITAWRAGQ